MEQNVKQTLAAIILAASVWVMSKKNNGTNLWVHSFTIQAIDATETDHFQDFPSNTLFHSCTDNIKMYSWTF